MAETIKLTVRLSPELYRRLKNRAAEQDNSLNQTVVEALWRGLEHSPYEPETEREKVRRVLRENGMLYDMGPQWNELLKHASGLSHAEIRERLKGLPPLSETIIEDREPRE
ncbi:MAG TPA: toxin-antitoxin system HicB family antitoxin [Anaerolineales bacterium]|nr:toxin-antitoxin system HicB family antitoxin [Anaerolineales bacterium]